MHKVFTNARLILDDAMVDGTLEVQSGVIGRVGEGAVHAAGVEDCEGDFLAPGLIDLHTDALEGHFIPRPKVYWPDTRAAVLAHDAQTVGSGITTVFDAICAGGQELMRAARRDLYDAMLDAVDSGGALFRADHLIHLRCELTDPDLMALVEPALTRRSLKLASLMDHTPGARQWRDVEVLRTFLLGIGKSREEVDATVTSSAERCRAAADRNFAPLAQMLSGRGIALASHDDTTPEHVRLAKQAGCTISEFPTTPEAAAAARTEGLSTIGGAPNMVRGGSHSGGVAMADLVAEDLLDAFASDYVPASLLQAVARLAGTGMPLPKAMALVTANPARLAGLSDRGRLAKGLRADLLRFRMVEGTPVVRQVYVKGERVF